MTPPGPMVAPPLDKSHCTHPRFVAADTVWCSTKSKADEMKVQNALHDKQSLVILHIIINKTSAGGCFTKKT